ncbi:hypothetical protein ACFFHH_21280 [Cytobacillus solani]|uniref:hypothetical protein n=1 Tax=Cytobacillus solani TaxID=1637975 RepID=UPI0006ABC078|nr:hypothetical protein [Cytobacillus solani]KOP78231.1 hypothetical protein AMS60_18890 [Bacillus sp. FJAT-21945]USK55537.1 hypothetical protein LIS82_03085 [Cytobacillus solani]
MIGEEKNIKLINNEGNLINGQLLLFEESPVNDDLVLIELIIEGSRMSHQGESFFLSLQLLREQLEAQQIQILCNGAAENVYPSPMQISMGTGELAYKLTLGKPASTEDIVHIFGYEETLKCVSLAEQLQFYRKWFDSLGAL